jgi:Zn-dependent protease
VLPQGGGLRLFRFAGISVFLHWSWFVVAMIEVQRTSAYRSVLWNAAEYLSLFAIVLLHELGHALACRQVGGDANTIVLWPLGGVAYVNPPRRPGATLWSVAAGPLVNVALAAPLFGAWHLARSSALSTTLPDAVTLLHSVAWINVFLFAFNVLPVYPLDGGQILRSLLWFVVGRARSLMVASVIGFVGVLALGLLTLRERSVWYAVLTFFLGTNCWRGFQEARRLSRAEQLPRRPLFACPSCRTAPPLGSFWLCPACEKPYDVFETLARCPSCGAQPAEVPCGDCGRSSSIAAWQAVAPAA